jgi:uncharacterized protein (DUF3820 family)
MKLGLIHVDEWTMGKHKGKPMDQLPTEYLTWVVYDSGIQGLPYAWAMKELDKREGLLKHSLGNAAEMEW